jgi:hypothetical protein
MPGQLLAPPMGDHAIYALRDLIYVLEGRNQNQHTPPFTLRFADHGRSIVVECLLALTISTKRHWQIPVGQCEGHRTEVYDVDPAVVRVVKALRANQAPEWQEV